MELHSAIKDLERFFKANSITSFEPVSDKDKVTIEFELHVASYVAPNKQENNFSFQLTIWVDNGRCRIITRRGSNVPFHPHFEIKRDWGNLGASYAEWIGYKQGELTLHQLIERMFFSLQFKPEYIDVEDESLIGNEKALLWYLKDYFSKTSHLPTADRVPHKHFEVNATPHSGKKFEVSPDNVLSKKKFAIQEEITFKPVAKRFPEYDVESRLNSLTDSLCSSSKIFITTSAREKIFSHIRWGDHHAKESKLEQGGLLLGKVYRDEDTGDYFGLAEQGIPGKSAQGSAIHLEMTHETWREMIDSIDHLLSYEENKDLQIIGWYHTHPNELDVFMSGTDMNTQRKYFNQDWHFAIVLNPQRRIWKAFSGARSMECKGFFLAAHGAALHHDDSGRQDNNEERRSGDRPPREQSVGLKKVLLLLALVTLIVVVLAKITSTPKGMQTGAPKQAKKNEQAKLENIHQPKAKAVMPPVTEYESIETELKKGTTINDFDLEEVFENPLANPLKVTAQKRIDSMMNIETRLFAYKDGIKVTEDSSLEISGNLRNTKASNDKALVGTINTHHHCFKRGLSKGW